MDDYEETNMRNVAEKLKAKAEEEMWSKKRIRHATEEAIRKRKQIAFEYEQDIQKFKRELRKTEQQSTAKEAYSAVKNYLELQDHQIKILRNDAHNEKLADMLDKHNQSFSTQKKRSRTFNGRSVGSTRSVLKQSPNNSVCFKQNSVNIGESSPADAGESCFPLTFITSNNQENESQSIRVHSLPSRKTTKDHQELEKTQKKQKELIPSIDDFFHGRTVQNFIRKSRKRSEERRRGDPRLRLYEQLEDLMTSDSFDVSSLPNSNNNLIKMQKLERNIDSQCQQRLNSAFNEASNRRLCAEEQNSIKVTDFQVRLLITKQTDKVQETNPRSNFDPARIPFFSVSKEIIQYYKNKEKGNEKLMRLLEQSMANRKEVIKDKIHFINSESNSPDKIKMIMRRKLQDRINKNTNQIASFKQTLGKLKDSPMQILPNFRILLNGLRDILLEGRNLSKKDLYSLAATNNIDCNSEQIKFLEKNMLL